MSKESNNGCIRGLELYLDSNSNRLRQLTKKLYHSTVITEQARQGMLGINEPERFRSLLTPQSDVALYQAQELAAQNEHEVYLYQSQERLRLMHKIIHTNSITPNAQLERDETFVSCGSSLNSSGKSTTRDSKESGNSCTSLLTDRFRRLKEKNARRLMDIYQQNGERGGEYNINKPFRFSRRESLLGIGNKGTRKVATTTSTNRNIDNIDPTTRDMMALMTHRRRMFLQVQQQQWAFMNMGTDLSFYGKPNFGSTRKRKLEEYFSQKHQQRERSLQAASLMSERDTRFSFRGRDILTNHHDNANATTTHFR